MKSKYSAIVIGVSAGGITALETILPCFDRAYQVPIIIVQHISADSDSYLIDYFKPLCNLRVKEAEDKETIQTGTIYFAPPGYHVLVELEKTIALSAEKKVCFTRPSINVLFDSAAEAYCEELIGVVLTGANNDGADGLAKIKNLGGLTIVQDPETAEVPTMPTAAIAKGTIDYIMPLTEIGQFLASIRYSEDI